MEKPSVEQIKRIVRNLTENDDPAVHKSTLETYFTPTAAFQHPIVDVKSAPNSLSTIKQVYAVYKVLTRRVEIHFVHVTLDADNTRAVIDLEESVNFVFLPFSAARVHGVRIVTMLDLARDQTDGKYYISKQYDRVYIMTDRPTRSAEPGIDVIPIDAAVRKLPFGFVYGWWRGICTLTGSAVGSGLQAAGLWATA